MAKARTEQLGPLPAPNFEGLVALDAIDPSPLTSRVVADEEAMDELVQSMRQDGLLYPIKVRPVNGRYQVVCGHRRLEAARCLGWEQVPVQVVELDDGEALRAALAENLKRSSLHPLEEAMQYQVALESLGWTQARLAEAVGRSRSYIGERLRLLQLPEELQTALRERVVTPAQAVLLEPLQQLNLVPDGVRAIREAKGEVTDENVERMVDDCFRRKTVSLDDQTPFAWQEECAQRGCLGTGPDGKPVCTSPANYVASVAAVHREGMEKALAEFLAGPGKKQGADGLPIFYDLDALRPGYGIEVGEVEGFARLPVRLAPNLYSDGEALAWEEHLPRVADKDACRACPAWSGKGPGRALLVRPPSRYMWSGGGKQVTILCMNARCRKKKHEEGHTAQEVKEENKKRQIEQAQAGLSEKAMQAMERLAGDRVLLLAASLVERGGINQEARLDWGTGAILTELGVSLPPFGGRADAIIQALKALGEDVLLRVHALKVVRSLDEAYQSWEKRWMPNRLEATLALLFGEEGAKRTRKA